MRRHINQYRPLARHRFWSRHPVANQAYRAAARATPKHRPQLRPMLKYLPSATWDWMTSVARYFFLPRHPFPGAEQAPQNSHYIVPDCLRVSLAGDWGTGTEEAYAVAREMMKWDGGGEPDLTIHIGDIYYVGGKDEVEQNCLEGAGKYPAHESVKWPCGRLGSFAMSGNHEMYARGMGYYDTFLPTLGMREVMPKGQGASFFCLENSHWRIVAVDTSYHSTSLVFKPSCRLPDKVVSWLAGVIPPDDQKAVVLVSHQQYFSAFEDSYPVPARQLSRFFNRWPVLWLWGHEHRSAAYDLFQLEGIPLKAYGRCFGHGGMPVETNAPATKAANLGPRGKLLFADRRINPIYKNGSEEAPLGINGFAQLLFEGPKLTIRHKSLVCDPVSAAVPSYSSSATLLTETFVCEGPRIKWGGFQEPITQIEGLEVYPHGKDGKSGMLNGRV